MGGSAIRSDAMRDYYTSRSHLRSATNASQVFKSNAMDPYLDPSKFKMPREARDSVESQHSRGIILAEDVTGSMGRYLLSLIQTEFPRLIEELYKSVSFDPHIMFMGVGDVTAGDRAPLQVTQFETDLRMLDQLQKIYVERGGGGNFYESYILPWYFAAKHTSMDCFEKRGEKGFLFTFGDEYPTPYLESDEVETVFGSNSKLNSRRLSGRDCLEMASEKFYCYHVMLHGSGYDSTGVKQWRELMGSRVCDLADHHYLPELVTTILKMYAGYTKTEAIAKISSAEGRRVVTDALKWHEETVVDEKVAVEGSALQIDIF